MQENSEEILKNPKSFTIDGHPAKNSLPLLKLRPMEIIKEARAKAYIKNHPKNPDQVVPPQQQTQQTQQSLPSATINTSKTDKKDKSIEHIVKQNTRHFVLDSICAQKNQVSEYNPLLDRHLGSFFSKKQNYKHLINSGIIKQNGILNVENPKMISKKEQSDYYDEYKKIRFASFVNQNEVTFSLESKKKSKMKQLLKSVNFNEDYQQSNKFQAKEIGLSDSLPDIALKDDTFDKSTNNVQIATSSSIDDKLLQKLPKIDIKDKFIQYAYIKPKIQANPYLNKEKYSLLKEQTSKKKVHREINTQYPSSQKQKLDHEGNDNQKLQYSFSVMKRKNHDIEQSPYNIALDNTRNNLRFSNQKCDFFHKTSSNKRYSSIEAGSSSLSMIDQKKGQQIQNNTQTSINEQVNNQ